MQIIKHNLEDYIEHCDEVFNDNFNGVYNPEYYDQMNKFFKKVSKAYSRNGDEWLFRMGPRNLN